jgi:guanine deaminase
MGDDRSVAEVYVAGKPMKRRLDRPAAVNVPARSIPELQTA